MTDNDDTGATIALEALYATFKTKEGRQEAERITSQRGSRPTLEQDAVLVQIQLVEAVRELTAAVKGCGAGPYPWPCAADEGVTDD